MPMTTLHDLLVHELKDLYSAEKQITKALPKMAKAVSSEELRQAFEEHLEQTKGQIERLEQMFELLEASARGKKCAGMEGLLEEGSELLEKNMDPEVRDAALIGAAQKVEHYEIAGYGTAACYANMLGLEDVARLLHETLEEEKETDQKLTTLAESKVNVGAQA